MSQPPPSNIAQLFKSQKMNTMLPVLSHDQLFNSSQQFIRQTDHVRRSQSKLGIDKE
jgi:hypothetical protein